MSRASSTRSLWRFFAVGVAAIPSLGFGSDSEAYKTVVNPGQADNPLLQKCLELPLTPAEATKFFETARSVDGTEWVFVHVVAPCEIRGRITIFGSVREFGIQPTGHGWLVPGRDGQVNERFICYPCSIFPDWSTIDDMAKKEQPQDDAYWHDAF